MPAAEKPLATAGESNELTDKPKLLPRAKPSTSDASAPAACASTTGRSVCSFSGSDWPPAVELLREAVRVPLADGSFVLGHDCLLLVGCWHPYDARRAARLHPMKRGTKRVSESGSLASVAVASGVLTHTRSPDRRARLVPLGTLGTGCRSCGVVCPGVMKIRSISGWGRLSARLLFAPCQRQIGRNWNEFQFRVGTLWARKRNDKSPARIFAF